MPIVDAFFRHLRIRANTLTYLNLIAADEAMNVAAAMGLDTAILAEVVSANGIGSPLFQSLLSNGSRTIGMPQSATELERVTSIGEKDLDCALDVGRGLGVELPVTVMTRQQIRRAFVSRFGT